MSVILLYHGKLIKRNKFATLTESWKFTVCEYTKIVALKLKTTVGKNANLHKSKGKPCHKDLHTKPKAKAQREKQ